MKKLLINLFVIVVVAIPTTTITSTNKRYSQYCVTQLEQQRQVDSAQRAALVQKNSQRNGIRTANSAPSTISIIDTSDRSLMDSMSDISDDETKVLRSNKILMIPSEEPNNCSLQCSKSFNSEQSCAPVSLSEQTKNNSSYLTEYNRQALAQTRAIYTANHPIKKNCFAHKKTAKTDRKSPNVIPAQNNENCLNQASFNKLELSGHGQYMQRALGMNFQDRYNNTPDQHKHDYYQTLVTHGYVFQSK